MKNYNVTVNGVTYTVTVEEIAEGVTAAPAAPAPVAAAPAPAAAPKAVPVASAAGEAVKAPMPGTILKMNVKVGDKVEKDSLVCILEAMKMENEIFSPVSGTVTAVNAPQGATVNSGDAIVTIA
ncbi:MAG: biotin/lipoyl-binding protein [Clostridia bacterium]|nr:biotin/lipoyl-binding protein [Clostridia bacterium]